METQQQQHITIPITGHVKREAVIAAMHASTAHLPAALAAAQRYAVRDGLGHLTEDDLRAAILHLRTIATIELAKTVSAATSATEGGE